MAPDTEGFPLCRHHNEPLRQIAYRDLCFVGLKAQVDAHVYVDDAPHNVIALREAGKDVLVFDALYNREIVCPETGNDYSNVPRVTNWVETADAILKRKAAWDRKQARGGEGKVPRGGGEGLR